jgi:site-specific DNA recombinase
MKRAAIYARFSTDMQNERSIEDQIALCRDYAVRQGFTVVETCEDRALSGASLHNRPGIQELMTAAKRRKFEIVVAESMSRIGRDQEDRAAIRKRLKFAGVTIMTPADGVVTDLTDGIRAVIDSQYLDDLKHAVRRGMSGKVRAGLSGGGLTYGYRVVKKFDEKGEPVKGLREVDVDQAAIVRRIFAEYIAGRSPRTIAYDLNRDGVPPPRGSRWNASTINGNQRRGNGVLNNELYRGRLIWNKVRMVKDPDTGRRVSRPNPEIEWQTVSVPDLAIVTDEMFQGAQQRKAAHAHQLPTHQRRPRHILSGLLRCAACGSGMSSYGGKNGQTRIRCTAAHENGTCPDPMTFELASVESAVLYGLRKELQHPDLIAECVRTYHAERQRLSAASSRNIARLERRGEIDREVSRLVDGSAKGLGDPQPLGDRMKVICAERRDIEAQLELTCSKPAAVTLHPGALARYEQQVGQLQEAISNGIKAGQTEAAAVIRELIESVTVRRQADGVEVEIKGRLNALLGEKAFPNGVRSVWGSLVAEDRLSQSPQQLHFV